MMRQLEAVEKVTQALKKDEAVRAIFLKGSLARGEGDEYSDVDLYCLVDSEVVDEFLPRRLAYLKRYKPLLFWSESDFVGPQIVAVYDDGLHFDLYTVTGESLQNTDEIKVLFDPDDLLGGYKSVPLRLNKEEVAKHFDEFTFMLLEFEAAYERDDLIWAARLASHMSGQLALLLRHIFDEDRARLGFKRLNATLEPDLHRKMRTAMNLSGPAHLPDGVIHLIDIAAEVRERLPEEISGETNIDFFNFMAGRIKNLS